MPISHHYKSRPASHSGFVRIIMIFQMKYIEIQMSLLKLQYERSCFVDINSDLFLYIQILQTSILIFYHIIVADILVLLSTTIIIILLL